MTVEQRAERRREQQKAYWRRQGIPARKGRPSKVRPIHWALEYCDIWGKAPGEPLTPEKFAKREPIWNAKVLEQQEVAERLEAETQRLERQNRREERGWQYFTPPPSPVAAPPSVGCNQPCPRGSGRKFKKCCGR